MSRLQACPCGSGNYPDQVFDGHGIFLCYTCEKCHEKRMTGYRPDIMERYECDEPIEPDDGNEQVDRDWNELKEAEARDLANSSLI